MKCAFQDKLCFLKILTKKGTTKDSLSPPNWDKIPIFPKI